MFKLFKELTKAPDALPRPGASSDTFTGHEGTLPYPARSRASIVAGERSRSRSPSVAPTAERAKREDEVETDEYARKTTELLKQLEAGSDGADAVMQCVEVLSQILVITPTRYTRKAFLRRSGHRTLSKAMEKQLARPVSAPGASSRTEEEMQVLDVQRQEGVRLAFEVLAWATGTRRSLAAFQAEGGYLSLLPVLHALSASPASGGTQSPQAGDSEDDAVPSPATSSRIPYHSPSTSHRPDAAIVAVLLAHMFGNNYTILSVVAKQATIDPSSSDLGTQLGDLSLRTGAALPLLWAYLQGTAEPVLPTGSLKGKEKAGDDRLATRSFHGYCEGDETTEEGKRQAQLLELVMRILLLSAQASTANLVVVRNHLPRLAEFLLTRLYGPPAKRQYAVTFPARDDRPQDSDYDDDDDDDDNDDSSEAMDWRPPSSGLRTAYHALLRKILEGGVNQTITWRLFELVRRQSPSEPPTPAGDAEAEPVAKTAPAVEQQPVSSADVDGKSGSIKRKAPKPPKIDIPAALIESVSAASDEALDPEVLDLIRHSMKCKWPDMFVLRSSKANEDGSLELKDLGRTWPSPQKGFSFSTWLYISKMNHAVTVMDVSQATKVDPLFRVRILENSQIAITSTVHRPEPKDAANDGTVPQRVEELVCAAPDALVPHHSWVHFGLVCRKLRTGDLAELRLFVNGARVGVMRIDYPVPMPIPPATTAPQLGAKPPVHAEAIRVSLGREMDLVQSAQAENNTGQIDGNEWCLGPTLMLGDAQPEDFMLLMQHLGPRYHGNLQEALGKFLTYEAAVSINTYLHRLAQASSDYRLFSQQTKSMLVKAIRTGPTISEDSIILSVSARDVLSADASTASGQVVNAAVPHQQRAQQLRHGLFTLEGAIEPHRSVNLDEGVEAVGGATVVLKMLDMARTTEEVQAVLGIIRDMTRKGWQASEEMERIHGYELLAAILRTKMNGLVDETSAKTLLLMLGINVDKPASAIVHNSVAYRAIGLDFELWSLARRPVTEVYLQHFEYLITTSKHARFNALRTFQKAGAVKKLIFALRSGFFDQKLLPDVIGVLKRLALVRWTGEDAIKPIFSYLVSALCQNPGFVTSPSAEAPPSRLPAALTLAMMAEISADSLRLVKLNRTVALHRLLVIFISSNSGYYVVLPCLDILHHCLTTPGLESFERSFEGEGGFALLARTLAPIWRDDIRVRVMRMVAGPDGDASSGLQCSSMVSSLFAALEVLLQAAVEAEPETSSPTPRRRRSSTIGSVRSLNMAMTTSSSSAETSSGDDQDLENLLESMTGLYQTSSAFRRAVSTNKVEEMLPTLVDFATITSSAGSASQPKREALAAFLSAIIDKSGSRFPNSVLTQLRLLTEQLRVTPSDSKNGGQASSSAFGPMSPASPRPATSYFGQSITGRFGSSPLSSPALTGMGSVPVSGGSMRRRPSTEAGLARRPSIVETTLSRSMMDKRIPLKRVLTGESMLEGGKDKNAAWKLIIISTDAQSHGKMVLERKEHWRRVCQQDWPRQAAALWAENGIWQDKNAPIVWRLDGSEGPLRMRNRLERVAPAIEQVTGRPRGKMRDAIPTADELSSAVSRINMAPWEDPFALALGDTASIAEEEPAPTLGPQQQKQEPRGMGTDDGDEDSFVEVEENGDDKMRRIARTLQAGDVVESAHNIVRIVGVDACPGLLILGKKNLYLVDGLVQTADGEVIDAKDAPRDVLSVPSGTVVELDPADQQSNRWPYNEIVETNKRAFLFRDVALELYFADKRNFLVVFADKRVRQNVLSRLSYKNDPRDTISRSVIGNILLDTVSRAMDRTEAQLEVAQRKWQNREISNFAYIQLLNQYANRTPNDVTQYPVFPWVLADYTSDVLDLDKDSSYRDLTLPMGALTAARREAAMERYSATEGVGEKPFHYGTHYSSSMIVCGFMIRLSPFTEIFLALQGGNFDLADRLFSSIPRAWASASGDNRGDVRELIPEFYYQSAFLLNMNRHDFGRRQVGEAVDDVELPPWAMGSPMLFTHRHREALESDYVSKHLASWIDLTFGYKQRDPASYNCFHPLSYRGAVDLDNMSDESEKAASTAIIHNFGQTPLQIFRTPHPHRYVGGRSELPVGKRFGVAEQWQLLLRSILPIIESGTPIDDIIEPAVEDMRPVTQRKCRLVVPGHPFLSLQYGFTDDSIRIYTQDTIPRLIMLMEGISVQEAIFASPSLLVTVSEIGVLTVWRFACKTPASKKGDATLQREATLRGPTAKVTCLAASKAWSFVVTGCEDGKAMVWDMNRRRYTRTLCTERDEPIRLCAINESDGQIVLASAHHLYLFSLNGHPIASTSVEEDDSEFGGFAFGGLPGHDDSHPREEFTGGISFLNREFLRYGVLFVVGVGTELALYRCMPGTNAFFDGNPRQAWTLSEQGRLFRSGEHPGGDCSMVKFIGDNLYGAFRAAQPGDRHLLYQWSLPEGIMRHVPEAIAHTCMAERCGRHFGLLEPKRFCGGCGGAFCSTHAHNVETFNSRYCETCRAQLSFASLTGVLGRRKDSAQLSSRRSSVVGAGSRRPSISGGTRSRRPSISGLAAGTNSGTRSRRPSVSAGGTPILASALGSSTFAHSGLGSGI